MLTAHCAAGLTCPHSDAGSAPGSLSVHLLTLELPLSLQQHLDLNTFKTPSGHLQSDITPSVCDDKTLLNQPEPAGGGAVCPAGGAAGTRRSARLRPSDHYNESHGEVQVLLLDGKGVERGCGYHTGQQVEGGAHREEEKEWGGGWRTERRD